TAQGRGQGHPRGQKSVRRQGDAARNRPPLHQQGLASDPRPARLPQRAQGAGAGLCRHEFHRQSLAGQGSRRAPADGVDVSRSQGRKDNRATEEGRGTEIDTWALDQSIDRGYAVATFYNGEVDPDRKEERGELYRRFPLPEGDLRGDETATIMFWAWGIS